MKTTDSMQPQFVRHMASVTHLTHEDGLLMYYFLKDDGDSLYSQLYYYYVFHNHNIPYFFEMTPPSNKRIQPVIMKLFEI